MGKLILIADDESKNLKLIRDLLQVSGYETIEATNGQEMVELARAKKPDLILTDILMPIMDGVEAARILKTDPATRDIPIVALTSHAMVGDKERILAAGCDEYLSKPLDTRMFLQTVAAYFPKSSDGPAARERKDHAGH